MDHDVGRSGDTSRVSVEISDDPGGVATALVLAHYQQSPNSRDDYAVQPPAHRSSPANEEAIREDTVTLCYLDRAITQYTRRLRSNPCELHLEQVLVKLKTARAALKSRIRCMQINNIARFGRA